MGEASNNLQQKERDMETIIEGTLAVEPGAWNAPAKRERFILCKLCGKPCNLIHDLQISDCCRAPVITGGRHLSSEDI